ncbi:MAG: ATP-dependent 6-phosphofructokinase [Nitrospinae bacterium]|nr:ATP-dependent 6-phosphofructokinase [Nitrospinota bacterium]
MRIGILTGGGDCPGLNAVIRSAVRAATGRHKWEVVGFLNGYKGLVENRFRPLDSATVSGLLDRGGTIIGTSNVDNPYKFAETVDGKRSYRDASEDVVRTYKEHNLGGLIVVGGDGTLGIARQLYKEKGLNIVGVPKTIDNDLSATDYTFGFDTAVGIVTDAVDRIKTTAESHERVMVVEVMGRDTGWIALFSGLASGAHIILIPEIPYDLRHVVTKIYERATIGKHFCVILVSEGAKPAGGQVTVKRHVDDPSMGIRLGGVGNVIAGQIEELTGIDTRVVTLGHVQRGGTPSSFDRILCTRLGVEAVNMIADGKFGMMACLKTPRIEIVPLEQAAMNRKVNPNDQMIAEAKACGISFGDGD